MVSPIVAGLDKKGENEYEAVIVNYDSIGCRDHQAFDCFTNYNAKNIKQAQFASDQYVKEMHKEVA